MRRDKDIANRKLYTRQADSQNLHKRTEGV
jgi:hypothetical protein